MPTAVVKLTEGDVFEFEGSRYVHVFGVIFWALHTTVISAVKVEDYDLGVFRFTSFQFEGFCFVDVVDQRDRPKEELVVVKEGERIL